MEVMQTATEDRKFSKEAYGISVRNYLHNGSEGSSRLK